MSEDRKPDFIERIQIEDEQREDRRSRRGAIRTLVITVVAMLLVGWGFMFFWVSIRSRFGRWGRERAREQG